MSLIIVTSIAVMVIAPIYVAIPVTFAATFIYVRIFKHAIRSGKGKAIFGSLSDALMADETSTLRYLCMKCGYKHNERHCPKCGYGGVKIG